MLGVAFSFSVTAFIHLGVYALPSEVARLAAGVATATARALLLGNQVVKAAVEGICHVKFLGRRVIQQKHKGNSTCFKLKMVESFQKRDCVSSIASSTCT